MNSGLIRKAFLWTVTLLLAGTMTACVSRDPLLGTWQEPNSGVMMELGSDGELVMSLNGSSLTMSYELEDPNVMIFVASEDGSIPDQRMTYQLKEDKLVLTMDGVDTVFYRVE